MLAQQPPSRAIGSLVQLSTAQRDRRSAAQRTRESELAGGAAATRPHADALNVLHFAAHRRPHQAGGSAGGGHTLCRRWVGMWSTR